MAGPVARNRPERSAAAETARDFVTDFAFDAGLHQAQRELQGGFQAQASRLQGDAAFDAAAPETQAVVVPGGLHVIAAAQAIGHAVERGAGVRIREAMPVFESDLRHAPMIARQRAARAAIGLLQSRPMRIAVLGPDPREFSLSSTSVTLGSGDDDDLRLALPGVQPAHARISHDARGYVLDVLVQGTPVYVNARPVRHVALLHAGDQISVGNAQVLLLGEHVREALPATTAADSTVAPGALTLRGVAGARSGSALLVAPTLDLGADGLPLDSTAATDVPRVRLFCVQGAPALRSLGLDVAAWPRVNGHPAASAWLRDGDQIALGGQRYLVAAPADAARQDAMHSFVPPEAAQPEDTAGPRREVWWLLLTAAAIALVLALLLALRH